MCRKRPIFGQGTSDRIGRRLPNDGGGSRITPIALRLARLKLCQRHVSERDTFLSKIYTSAIRPNPLCARSMERLPSSIDDLISSWTLQ